VVAFMAAPNTESPLDADVANEFATALPTYEEKARRAAASAPPRAK
jgi:ubiquitin-protein ligase